VNMTHLSTVTVVAIPPGTAEATAAPTETVANVQVSPRKKQIAQNRNARELKGETEVQREKPVGQPNAGAEPAAPEEPAPAEQPSTPQTRQTERLPKTAGELPLLGLVGVLCLGVGLGLKVLSTRS